MNIHTTADGPRGHTVMAATRRARLRGWLLTLYVIGGLVVGVVAIP